MSSSQTSILRPSKFMHSNRQILWSWVSCNDMSIDNSLSDCDVDVFWRLFRYCQFWKKVEKFEHSSLSKIFLLVIRPSSGRVFSHKLPTSLGLWHRCTVMFDFFKHYVNIGNVSFNSMESELCFVTSIMSRKWQVFVWYEWLYEWLYEDSGVVIQL